MRILTLHCDYIKFKAEKKALKSAEEVKDKKEVEVSDPLVVLTAVEKGDGNKEVLEVVEAVEKHAKDVNAKEVVLYPYAHLSSNLAKPEIAVKLMTDIEKLLSKKFSVTKAPFGYYKSFELRCKGHPLSELSKEFGLASGEKQIVKIEEVDNVEDLSPEKNNKEENKALKAEKKLQSYWHIMTPDGKMHDLSGFNFSKHENLKKFAFYEKEKSRAVDKEPVHVKLMRKLELVDYEPGSDQGNLRYYPKGKMIKSLIEQFVSEKIRAYGGLEIESPIMYDMNHPTLHKYLQRFPARQYQIDSDKRHFFLRFAACFGQFLMAKDASISYKDLPLKLYELTRYSFRKEQSGELAGLRRLRTFTMPDVHALCADMKQAKEEFKERFRLSLDIQKSMGIDKKDLELAVRFTKEFYEENKEIVEWLVKQYGKPVLIEMWDERFFYFVLKYELNFVDSVNKAAALTTDQIDVENAERYGIKFTSKSNKPEHPLILHCSPSGAIERVMYALLEKAGMSGKNELPYWLYPTQARILPVSEKYVKDAVKIAENMNKQKIRTDVDDRDVTLPKKVSDAEKEWVPFIVVVGEKELKSGKLALRTRGEKKIANIAEKTLIDKLVKEQGYMPWTTLPLNMLVSKRPVFVG